MWVSAFALVVCAVGCALGLTALIGPGMPGMDPAMSASWAGRTVGLGLAPWEAVLLKSPSAHVVAFVAGLSRELGDPAGELGKPQPGTGVVLRVLVFAIASTMGALAANKARRRQA